MSLSLAEIEALQTTPQIANIREPECIGCTKCIQACPFDVIIGAAKQMHTVLNTECTGCGLCVPACPVDCIDLIPIPQSTFDQEKSHQRFYAREKRLAQKKIKPNLTMTELSAQAYVQAAVERAKLKKSQIGG